MKAIIKAVMGEPQVDTSKPNGYVRQATIIVQHPWLRGTNFRMSGDYNFITIDKDCSVKAHKVSPMRSMRRWVSPNMIILSRHMCSLTMFRDWTKSLATIAEPIEPEEKPEPAPEKILDKLKEIFTAKIKITDVNTWGIRFREECDQYFYEYLTPDEVRQLARELEEIADQVEKLNKPITRAEVQGIADEMRQQHEE